MLIIILCNCFALGVHLARDYVRALSKLPVIYHIHILVILFFFFMQLTAPRRSSPHGSRMTHALPRRRRNCTKKGWRRRQGRLKLSGGPSLFSYMRSLEDEFTININRNEFLPRYRTIYSPLRYTPAPYTSRSRSNKKKKKKNWYNEK